MGRLRLDSNLKRRYLKLKQLYSILTQKGFQYCADKPIGLKFGFEYCQQMVEEEGKRDKGRLIEFLFLSF